MFTSEEYKHQDKTTIDGKTDTDGRLVLKAGYICSIQVNTNWYWNQHPQQHVITVPTLKILHPQLQFNAVMDFHDIPQKYMSQNTRIRDTY